MTRAWIGLGANLGEPRRQIEEALRSLAGDPRVTELIASELLETEPVGGPPGQPRYWNGAARFEFDGSAPELLALLQALESRAGRRREVPNGPRTLDLDLLLFGAERHRTPELCVPHPRLEERSFVLEPLAEIDPGLVLPRSGQSVARLAAELRANAPLSPASDGGW